MMRYAPSSDWRAVPSAFRQKKAPVIDRRDGGGGNQIQLNQRGEAPLPTVRPSTGLRRAALAQSLAAAVNRSLDEGWTQPKGPTAEAYATDNLSLDRQVSKVLAELNPPTTP